MNTQTAAVPEEKPLLAKDFPRGRRGANGKPLVLYARRGVSTADRIRAAAQFGCLVLVEGGKDE